jgi:hypothetical protein
MALVPGGLPGIFFKENSYDEPVSVEISLVPNDMEGLLASTNVMTFNASVPSDSLEFYMQISGATVTQIARTPTTSRRLLADQPCGRNLEGIVHEQE